MSEKELFKLIIRLSTVIDMLEKMWKLPTDEAQGLSLLMLYDARETARTAYREVAESEAGT